MLSAETQNPETSIFETEALPHLDDLFRVALRMLQDQGRAGDAVQETYLIAWKSFSKYEAGTNCRAWLFRILFNVVRHERRSWFKWITGREEDFADAQLTAPAEIPDAITDGAILAALDQLPPAFRSVVLLIDVEEFSYKEASGILEIPIGTVMSRLNRGRKILRDQLATTAQEYGIIRETRPAIEQTSSAHSSPCAAASGQNLPGGIAGLTR